MRINYNTQAMRANDSLSKADNLVAKSIQRLSSGLKVNAAKDNPSGYAISKRMNMQIEGLSTATQSANDGISIIETVDGAMSEIHDMLHRMNELAIKSANGTLVDADRKTIQSEISQLKEEITRIANTTEFNGQVLMDGTFDLKGYTNQPEVKVLSYSDEVSVGEYKINIANPIAMENGNIKDSLEEIKQKISVVDHGQVNVTRVDGNRITLAGDNNFEIVLELKVSKDDTELKAMNVVADITGIGAMNMQIGANEGQTLAIRIPTMSLANMGIESVDVSTRSGAEDTISRMDYALKYVSDARSRLGAYQNRLEHTLNSLSITSENLTKAYSGIVDVDMAEETTKYTTQQVISQAATSVLAQANERPSQVLQLLQ